MGSRARRLSGAPTPERVICLGIDPGRESGVALVELVPTPGKAPYPALHGSWAVWGASDRLWFNRATAAVHEATRALGEGCVKIAFIEEIPATFRTGSIKGVKRGHAAWAGLGKRWGAWQSILFGADWEVREIEQSDWTKLCGVEKSKEKAGGPAGRVREASTLVAGAAKALAKIENEKIQGDAAESVLIGLAGAVLLSREASAKASVPR
jgi:hypothetical protein